MLLTIHNLPSQIRYSDIRALIGAKCGLSEVILDNLTSEGKTKKVTVGLAEEEDAAILTRNINGIYYEGRQLFVQDLRQKTASDRQPYRKTNQNPEKSPPPAQSNYQAQDRSNYGSQNQPNYQTQMNYMSTMNQNQNQYQNQYQDYQSQGQMAQAGVHGQYGAQQQQYYGQQGMPMMVPGMGGMFYMPQMQNSFADYTGQGQMAAASQFMQYPGQQEQTREIPGVNNDQNRMQESMSYGYGAGQQDPSSNRGRDDRERSRWQKEDRSGGDSRRRSRSPHDSRSRDSGRSRNPRYNKSNERKDSKVMQGSQRYGSGRNETFTSQHRNDVERQDQKMSAINSKLMGFAGTIQPQSSSYHSGGRDQGAFGSNSQKRNDWNSESGNSKPQGGARNWQTNNTKTQAIDPWINKVPPGSNEHELAQSSVGWNRGSNYDLVGNGSQPPRWDSAPVNETYQPNRGVPPTDYGTRKRSNQASVDQPQRQRTRFDREKPLSFQNKSQSPNQKSLRNDSAPKVDPWASNSDPQPASWRNNFGPKEEPRGGHSGVKVEPWANNCGPKVEPQFQRPQTNFKQRVEKFRQEPAGSGPAGPKPRREKAGDTAAVIRRDTAYRQQATAVIVKQMRNNNPEIEETVVKDLKKAVRSRLELLLTDSIGMSQEEMITKYRRKFPAHSDEELYQAVIKQLDKIWTQPGPKTVGPEITVPVISTKPKPVKQAGAPGPAPKKKAGKPGLPSSLAELPKNLNSDKTMVKALKKRLKEEFKDDNYYRDELVAKHPLIEPILTEEVDAVCNILKNILENPELEEEKKPCKIILVKSLNPVKKQMTLNVTKRILNIPSGLSVRIYAFGKPPQKADLQRFLDKYHVVSLVKSHKKQLMYVATLGSFEHYDEICHMEKFVVNPQTTLVFKPLQVAGPRMSVRERRRLQLELRARAGGAPEGEENSADEEANAELDEGDVDIQEEEAGAAGEGAWADEGGAGAAGEETGVAQEEVGADKEGMGVAGEEAGANEEGVGADGEEAGADDDWGCNDAGDWGANADDIAHEDLDPEDLEDW